MALTPNQRIAKLREKNKRQVDIAAQLGFKRITHVNNIIHNRNKKGKKAEKIRSAIAKELLPELSYKDIWGSS